MVNAWFMAIVDIRIAIAKEAHKGDQLFVEGIILRDFRVRDPSRFTIDHSVQTFATAILKPHTLATIVVKTKQLENRVLGRYKKPFDQDKKSNTAAIEPLTTIFNISCLSLRFSTSTNFSKYFPTRASGPRRSIGEAILRKR